MYSICIENNNYYKKMIIFILNIITYTKANKEVLQRIN